MQFHEEKHNGKKKKEATMIKNTEAKTKIEQEGQEREENRRSLLRLGAHCHKRNRNREQCEGERRSVCTSSIVSLYGHAACRSNSTIATAIATAAAGAARASGAAGCGCCGAGCGCCGAGRTGSA